ncbi:condensation domain-containing protein [Tumebacillus permanentifrigoris]|uniref:Ketoacyl-synthetase-like protein n=1 Tax=Tumebacillus permanentifrigoris TaxID=378543 RepID=A0A316DB91_9BACL|nr:condensation domain-containing protein [Tumebacillus permanentifrigoris]PWK14998.1 ketoacyl-synthetase-like protein [Tumebacillus permanentifrigoris]
MGKKDNSYTGHSPEARDLAIIGMSGTFPMASSLQQVWENQIRSLDCIRELPANRREAIDHYVQATGGSARDGNSYAKRAYLEEIDGFDYAFFHLSQAEASFMDPTQRLFLQSVWHVLEEAGYGGNQLQGTRTGVFYGTSETPEYKYSQMVTNVQPEDRVQATLGNLTSLIPSRISYLMDWRGPSMVIDTSGSSSLVALHQACQSIRAGECEQAVVGTGWLNLLPLEDPAAAGKGSGEAVMAVLVKSLEKAVADGDHIHAVIKGSSVNQDGRSFAIGGPNASAQESLLVQAWEDAGIDPASLSFIEAHGALETEADLLELESLHRALTSYTDAPKHCAVTSVVSHLGHLQHATGLAGLITSVLALKNRQLPPMHHLASNRALPESLANSPLYLAEQVQMWTEQQHPLRCGVSSFGISGTNCHVVLEEAPAVRRVDEPSGADLLFTLSARSESVLQKLIGDYLDVVKGCEEADLQHLCYTANTGRGHYEHRIAMVIHNQADFVEKLTQLRDQSLASVQRAEVYYGFTASELVEAAQPELYQLGLAALCQAYVAGTDLEWSRLYAQQQYRKLSLPVYPFEKHRCWIGMQPTETPVVREHEPVATAVAQVEAAPEATGPTLEQTVKELFCHYLGYDEIDEAESFYELGGDSIVAVKIVNDINNALHQDVTIVDLFNHPSVQEFCAFLEQVQADTSRSVSTIQRLEPRAFYPLSPSQRRVFVMTQFEPQLTMYNMPHAAVIEGRLDINKFQAALNRVIRRHDSLRTSFEFVQHEPMQVIHDHVDVEIEMYSHPIEEAQIQDELRAFTKLFDLKKAPLIRVALAELTNQKHVCFLDMHHIISDGTSMSIFVNELLHQYESESELAPLSIQYKDYAVWQNDRLQAGQQEKLEQFWADKFSDRLPVLALPTDHSRPERRSFEGDLLQVTLGKEQTELLYQFSKRTGVTTYVILLAAYHLLLTKHSGQEDVIIGTWVQGRPVKELNELIGMFVQTIPMRNHAGREMTFTEFLKQVQANTLQSFEHQDYPFEDIVNNLNLKRDLSRNPVFDVAFSLQNMDKPVMNSQSLQMELLPTHNGVALFDITLYMYETEEGLTSKWEYSTSLFEAQTIEQWGQDYYELLLHLVNHPDVPLAESDLIFQKQVEVENVEFLF